MIPDISITATKKIQKTVEYNGRTYGIDLEGTLYRKRIYSKPEKQHHQHWDPLPDQNGPVAKIISAQLI